MKTYKKVYFLAVLCFFCTSYLFAQTKLSQTSFKKGEKCTYSISIDGVEVAEASFETTTETANIAGKTCVKVQASGKAIGATSLVADIQNQFYSWIDVSAMQPKKFQAYIKGGKSTVNEVIEFNQATKNAMIYNPVTPATRKNVDILTDSQDALSGFYYFRNIDFSKIPEKTTFSVTVVADNKLNTVELQYLGKKKITTAAFGLKDAYVLMPILKVSDEIEPNSVRMSVSADANQVPLKVIAKTKRGFVSVELKGFQAGR